MGEANRLRPEVNQNANVNVSENANVADDSPLKLQKIVNLPFEPLGDSPWREDTVPENAEDSRLPGPTDRKLTAVLKFSEEDTAKLMKQLKTKGKPKERSINAETWFPAELIAHSQTTGDNTLKGLAYSADDFMKPPYSEGSIIRVADSDYFVLTLYTK